MDLLDELKAEGCDVEDGLNRLMGNRAMYEKLIKKIPASIAPLDAAADFETNNIEKAIADTHTIKGITGNLSITPLYKAYTEIVNLLRAGKTDEAKHLYDNTLEKQKKILAIIAKYSE